MPEDPRRDALRYQSDKVARELGFGPTDDELAAPADPAKSVRRSQAPTVHDRSHMVETAIQQAMRRGEFDNLPGAGKPLTGLGGVHDPDWWIRQKIEREQLTGLGPPALALRTEHADLDQRLDQLFREDEVRGALQDFNRRVIEARRQLQGGPPVVTPTRDVETEVSAWRDRRESRRAAEAEARRVEADRVAVLSWRERWRARRNR